MCRYGRVQAVGKVVIYPGGLSSGEQLGVACLGGVDLGGASLVDHDVGGGAVAHARGISAGSGTDAKLGGQVAHMCCGLWG